MNNHIHYLPFGMLMPGRSYSSTAYRYGFNGKENDIEVKGDGNQQDYGARLYDSRLGRWLSVDPLQKNNTSVTPYNYCVSNPIIFIDPDGRTNIIYIVNVPDATGKLTISNEILTARIAELNQYVSNLNIKYTLFDDAVHKKGDPAPVLTHLPISKRNLDNSDAIILIGNPEDVKKYDRDNDLTHWIYNLAGDKGWKGAQDDDSKFNPEKTSSSDRVGYLDGDYISRNNVNGCMFFKFLSLHSTGHVANPYKGAPGTDDHINLINGKPAPSNILNSAAVLDGKRSFAPKSMQVAIDRDYLKEALNLNNNKIFFERINTEFKPLPVGPPAKDNYFLNKKCNENNTFKNPKNN